MTMASPLEILIGIHYWTAVGDYSPEDPAHANSPGVRSCVKAMLGAGLLANGCRDPEKYPSQYQAGPGLGVWIEALCVVPFPVQQWIIPKEPPK